MGRRKGVKRAVGDKEELRKSLLIGERKYMLFKEWKEELRRMLLVCETEDEVLETLRGWKENWIYAVRTTKLTPLLRLAVDCELIIRKARALGEDGRRLLRKALEEELIRAE
ncbi:MAG: hypothetical protein NZ992_00730 [Candidatus Korarchaeum sp.]|nr:hypothetical protein [Candidatus Korarchaeum sp.]MDW8035521.1 hypothetical protein [Candidatus Korarchaeum sp.]